MIHFEVSSKHDPETWLKIWDQKIVELNSDNKSAYSGEKCFFGSHKGRELMTFYHKDYSTIYMATRFMGHIEAEGSGSRISGVIGKMRSARIFLWFMFFAMGAAGIVLLTQQQFQQAGMLFILALVGLVGNLYTPGESVTRLEKLLKLISDEPYTEAETAEETTAEKTAAKAVPAEKTEAKAAE